MLIKSLANVSNLQYSRTFVSGDTITVLYTTEGICIYFNLLNYSLCGMEADLRYWQITHDIKPLSVS